MLVQYPRDFDIQLILESYWNKACSRTLTWQDVAELRHDLESHLQASLIMGDRDPMEGETNPGL